VNGGRVKGRSRALTVDALASWASGRRILGKTLTSFGQKAMSGLWGNGPGCEGAACKRYQGVLPKSGTR